MPVTVVNTGISLGADFHHSLAHLNCIAGCISCVAIVGAVRCRGSDLSAACACNGHLTGRSVYCGHFCIVGRKACRAVACIGQIVGEGCIPVSLCDFFRVIAYAARRLVNFHRHAGGISVVMVAVTLYHIPHIAGSRIRAGWDGCCIRRCIGRGGVVRTEGVVHRAALCRTCGYQFLCRAGVGQGVGRRRSNRCIGLFDGQISVYRGHLIVRVAPQSDGDGIGADILSLGA